jgi:hypothetical protein
LGSGIFYYRLRAASFNESRRMVLLKQRAFRIGVCIRKGCQVMAPHGKKRIRLNDDQRRRLTVKGKILGCEVLGEIGTIATLDTILRWHRQLVRNHQCLDNHLIGPGEEVARVIGEVQCRERLGGLLAYYDRDAA